MDDSYGTPGAMMRGGHMATKRVVHIVGTGTIGEPLIGLFLNLWGSDSPKLASLALEVFVSGS
jgi:hypothetical protein